jgi:PAS domain S-box-containing protein
MRSFEQRLHSVMAFSSDFICLLDRNFTIEYINPALQNYFTALYKIKVNAGEKWNEVLPEEVTVLTSKLLKETENEGEGRTYVSFKKIHVDFTATLLLENNETGAYLIIGRNITEFSETLAQLKKSRENYKFITDNLNDVIWTRKKNHKINFISPSILRQRGFTPKEYIELPLEKTMSAASAKEMNKIIQSKGYLNYSKENPLVIRGEYLKKDGSIMNGETYVYPIFEKGKLKRILGITRDIGERIAYLNKIEHQNSELESILNNTDEQIISINKHFEYVTINNVAKKVALENFNKEPKIGESIFNYNSVANSKKLRFAFNKVMNGENFHYIFRLPKKDRIEYLDARFRPIFLNNEVFGISMFIKNISENIYTQIALKENEQRLKRITDTALEGVWEYSSKNNSLYLSPRMKELVGFKGENDLTEFVTYIRDIMDEKDLKSIIESIQSSLINQKNIEIASKIKIENKGEKWILVRASISYNLSNKPQTISGVIIDISRQKEQEEELKEAKIKAEEMMNLKSNFLANMSHEVRTPLNGILGVTQLLEKEGLPEEINYYLDLQKKSGFRLLDTINNILSISRLEAAQENHDLETVELNSFIENNVGSFKILAEQKGIKLRFNRSEEGLNISMNEHLFYQVFNNLLGNAIKFTSKGSVAITTNKKNAHAELIVKDTGIGISDEFKTKIFEAFEQESTGKNRHFEGSGLGLAIVKKYMDKLGGEIIVESTKHKGSSFTLLLPLREGENEK